MHGDESDVIAHVHSCVQSLMEKFPDFIYLPTVSPSAVSQKTRINAFGHDINRCFTDPLKDPEAAMVRDQISHLTQAVSLDFHEDNTLEHDFYFYDTGEMKRDALESFRRVIQSCGLRLYDGIDDPDDPTLGCNVDNGYVSHGHQKDAHESGFLTKWMAHRGIISRAFTFEVPGKCSAETKNLLVRTIFSFFIDSKFMIQ